MERKKNCYKKEKTKPGWIKPGWIKQGWIKPGWIKQGWIIISFFILLYPFLSFFISYAAGPTVQQSEEPVEENSLSHVYEVAQDPEEEAKKNEDIIWPVDSEGSVEGPGDPEKVDHKERLKQIVSVAFKDMDLKQALSVLAESYDLNILAGDDVKGAITVNFKDVPLEDVLTQILKLKNFTYKWEGNIIRVISAEEAIETRKFPVNHVTLDLAREIIADKLSKDGKVRINTVTNHLIVTDIASKLDTVAKTLEDIDMPPEQVRIETKLIDISHTDLDNLGVSWETASLDIVSPFRLFDKKTRITQADYQNNTGSSSTLSAGQFTLGFTRADATFTATIDALIRHTKARVIANPSITTLNNIEARVTIGVKYPIREQTQTSTGTLETTRFVDVGTTLKVTPKINKDGTIQLTIHPEVSSVSTTVDAGPVITTREADTTVLVKDGETVIIAGLLQTQDDVNKSRVPFLGSLPIIGAVFSSRDKDKEQKELVIFMTPRIVNVLGKTVNAPAVIAPSEVELVGERVNAIEMFDKAEDLEKGTSLHAKVFPVGVRLGEAAKTYERICLIFPNNYYAEIGLYRAGWIYEFHLKNYEAAVSCYSRILEAYPKSSYAKEAKSRIEKLTPKIKNKKY